MIVATDVLKWGRERARARPWRNESTTAFLTPLPPGPPPSVEFLRHCLAALARRGFTEVLTGALTLAEAEAFWLVGFEEHERLRLLAHDLHDVPQSRLVELRRGNESHWPEVLNVDIAAFPAFWRLDLPGLVDAMGATPMNRFRVAVASNGRPAGYAISGRSGRQGYLQRLAVDPAHHREGLGLALTVDGLAWMRRRGVRRAVVNTQLANHAAFGLYLRAGFRPETGELVVLRRRVDP